MWHFGYPTADAEKDPNCVFPLERMRELEAEQIIGELSDPAFSFMGGIYSARKVRDELAPKIVEELRRAHVDALLPGARLTRLPSVRWTDCPSGRRGGNPYALYDLGARHHAVGEGAARGIREFPAGPSDRATR